MLCESDFRLESIMLCITDIITKTQCFLVLENALNIAIGLAFAIAFGDGVPFVTSNHFRNFSTENRQMRPIIQSFRFIPNSCSLILSSLSL